MFRTMFRALGCALAGGLAACVSAPPEVPFDHVSAGNIKVIGVVTPAFPERPDSILAASVGATMTASLGLLGMIRR